MQKEKKIKKKHSQIRERERALNNEDRNIKEEET